MKHRPLEPVFLQRRGRISKDDSAVLELHAQEQRAVRRKTVSEGSRSSFMPVWVNGWLILASWSRYLRVLPPLPDSRRARCCNSAAKD